MTSSSGATIGHIRGALTTLLFWAEDNLPADLFEKFEELEGNVRHALNDFDTATHPDGRLD